MAVPFWKYHGLGNDFIVIDATSGGLLVEAGQARQLCERHTGIGADGLLVISIKDKSKNRASNRIGKITRNRKKSL